MVRRAIQASERHDIATAVVSLRRALALGADNVEATRQLAVLAEEEMPREAVALLERVCTLAPSSRVDAESWARVAISIGDIGQAEEAVALLRRMGSPSITYHRLAARLALAQGQAGQAREHFAAALEIEPHSEQDQLGLAIVEIGGNDPAALGSARESLQRLRRSPAVSHDATRALISDAIRREQMNEAMALAASFVRDPAVTFEDRLQYLAVLRTRESPGVRFDNALDGPAHLPLSLLEDGATVSFHSYLNTLRDEAQSSAVKAAKLIAALNGLNQELLAADWAAALPAEVRIRPPVAPPLADSYCKLRDWGRLAALTADADWQEAAFVCQAFSARLAREKGDRQEAVARWSAAVKATEYRAERLSLLGRMALNWGWSEEWEEVACAAAKTSKRPREPLLALADYYRSRQDAPRLFAVWSQLLALDPADFTARKNWVRLALVLKGDPYRTGALAEELYRQHPEDPEVAVTYALVQNQRELYAEALSIMNRLSDEQLKSPRVAGFHAVILVANRQPAAAGDYFARSREAPLLREEREIIERVRRRLD